MGFYRGIQYNIKGLAFALKSPKLILLGCLRFSIILLLTILCFGLVLYWHNEILNAIWKMPDNTWMLYLWKIVSWLLSIFLGALSMVFAYLLSQVLFCVFIMDYMSKITEAMISGKKPQEATSSWLSLFWYLFKQEIPRAVIPVVISVLIMIMGLVTPVSFVIIAISSITAATFLAWDNTDLVPARRMYSFKDRLAFLKHNLAFHIGFGLLFLIPWANILFLSFAPVGATLYYIENTKESISPIKTG